MSLGVLIRGPEGLVFAAESRVSLNWRRNPSDQKDDGMPCNFDTANKLLTFREPYTFVGAVTFGRGTIGNRTAYSYIPEIEAKLPREAISVKEFAQKLYEFFINRWPDGSVTHRSGPVILGGDAKKKPEVEQMKFIIGGYDDSRDPFPKAYEIWIPGKPEFTEGKWIASEPKFNPLNPNFGVNYGGVSSYADRLFKGYDLKLSEKLCNNEELALNQEQKSAVIAALKGVSVDDAIAQAATFAPGAEMGGPAAGTTEIKEAKEGEEESALKKDINALEMPTPLEAMALQDCVDLAILLVRTTIEAQRLTAGGRGCGGPIDVVTISPYVGVKHIQQKTLEGERTLR